MGGEPNKKPVFCLVDPSLSDFIGHHYEYDRAVVEGAETAGFDVVCLANQAVTDEIVERLPVRKTFLCDIWTPPPGTPPEPREDLERACNDQFLADLQAATSDLKLDRDSIVFGHMVTARQLLGWARFAQQHAGPNGPTIVLLLRYQPEHYMGHPADEGFQILQELAKDGRIRLSSDSSRLAHQLERLTTLPVEIWPLPHTTELGDEAKRKRDARRKRLRVVSLGNARDEKGILELLDAVRIIEALGQSDRFDFVFQVNDAAPDIEPAIRAFAEEQRAGATLLTQSLSTEAYFDLLKSADIVALPYWRDIYMARTSGVFLEAVAAGKPVVCTDDTWMSDQLALAGAGVLIKDRDETDLANALIKCADDFEAMDRTARATAGKWLEFHNPDSFMRALLHGEAAPTAVSSRPTAAVLYPWGDAVQNTAGAALRVNLFARFLKERCSQVRLLQDGSEPYTRRDGVQFESFPLLSGLERTKAFLWLSRFCRHILRAKNGEEIYLILLLLPRFSKTFYRRVNEIVRNSDLIFLEYPFWAPTVARACRANGKRFILTTYDVISDQVRASRPLRWITRWLERRNISEASDVVAVTESDRAVFESWGRTSALSPNCVDAETCRQRLPADTRSVLLELCGLAPDTRHIFIFVGSRFLPNVVAAGEVKRIAEAFQARWPKAKAEFLVAGSCMERERQPGFSALGRVDDLTLKLMYEHASAVLIPLTLGTGLSLKTVEALAGGHLVVGTSVAFRGIPAGDDTQAWIEENDLSAYPDLLHELISAPKRSREIAAAGRVRSEALDFRTAFAPFLDLEPRLAASPPRLSRPDQTYVSYVLDAAAAATRLGRHELALDLLRKLRASHPDEAAVRHELAAALSESDGREALKEADASIRLGYEAMPSLILKSRILSGLGRTTEADEAWRAAVALAVSQIWVPVKELKLRASLWDQYGAGERRWIHDVTAAVRARRTTGLTSDYAYLYAKTSQEAGRADPNAYRNALQALELGFDRFWGLILCAQLAMELGRVSDAALHARDAHAIAPDDKARNEAVFSISADLWPLFHAGDFDGLQRRTRSIMQIWPDHALANYLHAEALRITGHDLAAAINHYVAGARLGGEIAYWSHFNRGVLLADCGEHFQAVAALLDALDVAGDEKGRDHVIRSLAEAAVHASQTADIGAGRVAAVIGARQPNLRERIAIETAAIRGGQAITSVLHPSMLTAA